MRNDLVRSLQTSFIDQSIESSADLRTNLLVNTGDENVFRFLKAALKDCDEFYLSVAFVTKSGLAPLLQVLKDLETKGVKGRIITSDYLTFTEPDAIEKLMSFQNIDIRIFTGGNLHAKGNIFKNQNVYEVIIGSSNLTQQALFKNQEWNIRLSSLWQGEFLKKVQHEFELLWKQSIFPNEEWLKDYQQRYQQKQSTKLENHSLVAEEKSEYPIKEKLEPNPMQKEALSSLAGLRQKGARRALLISATGTGKTYLSAFDVKKLNPKRMLFLVHREQILKQAKESFKNVVGSQVKMGILSGSMKDTDADYLFSTIQMMAKEDVHQQFPPTYFDYIIIDESHRVGAATYQSVIDYFKPNFLLGMTATPERTDDFNIYETFDYNIAYEIRLQQALEMDLLTPFHYFGVTDIKHNGQLIQDKNDDKIGQFKLLISNERVNHIIDKVEYYGYCGNRVKGLVFCSNQNEAKELSDKFNERGYRTVALLGNSSQDDRQKIIQKLAADNREEGIDYIFTVDIFNEGVDIPEVNQIVMLRPTESVIVFVQQLGRGLRKAQNKEYVNVIDFIGNYKGNFLIPTALTGDRSFDKDNMIKTVGGGIELPGASTVDFDPIAKQTIYDSISQVSFKKKFLSDKFNGLKEKIGRVPLMMDFVHWGDIEPMLIIEYAKSYYSFLETMGEAEVTFSEKEALLLEFMYSQLSNGMRPHELIILGLLYKKACISEYELSQVLAEAFDLHHEEDSIQSAINMLLGQFIVGTSKIADVCLVETRDGVIELVEEMKEALHKPYFKKLYIDLLKFGLNRYETKYRQRYEETPLKLYERYSRKDVCRLLNWDKDESATVNGYPRSPRKNTIPIFVTYHKDDDISATTKYEDHFIDRDTFNWLSRSSLRINSKEIQSILNAEKNHDDIHLFIKKDDSEGKELYYMGLMTPIYESVNETSIMNDKGQEKSIVNMQFHLKTSVDEGMYTYLLGE